MRARLKRVEELDPHWICCDSFSAVVNEEAGKIVILAPEVHYGSVRCRWCGREFAHVPFRRLIAGKLRGLHSDCSGIRFSVSVVAIPLVDLDEGEERDTYK